MRYKSGIRLDVRIGHYGGIFHPVHSDCGVVARPREHDIKFALSLNDNKQPGKNSANERGRNLASYIYASVTSNS